MRLKYHCLFLNSNFPCAYTQATTESGELRTYNALTGGDAIMRAAVHSKECLVAVNPAIPYYVATAGADKRIKLWDLSAEAPVCLFEKDRKAAVCLLSICTQHSHNTR